MRFHAPLGCCRVLRPVGRLKRPPQIPLRGDSPVVRPRWPPLHQLLDGGAGRPVQFNAGHRHGVSLCKTWCILVPALAPCVPLLPRGTVPPLLLPFLPWLPLLSCASLFTRALPVPSTPLCVSSAPPPCALTSCHAIAPLLSSYPLDSDGPVCTIQSAISAPCGAFTLVCHPCVLPLPIFVVPTLFPDVVLHPHPVHSVFLLSPILGLCLRSPTLFPSGTPWVHGKGGGLLPGWIVALIVDRLGDGLLGSDDRDYPHPAGTSQPQ